MASANGSQLLVHIVTEYEEKHRQDMDSLAAVPGFRADAVSPLSFVLSLHSLGFGSVAVLELPFVQENERELLDLLTSSAVPAVIVTDEPLRYLGYTGKGTVQIVMREPGYTNHLPGAVRAAHEAAALIVERNTLEKRLQEYAQYLETINKIMEHDIGDMNQAILTFSELLRGSASPANRNIIDNILSQSKTLGNLINSFSRLAQLARGNVEEMTVKPQELAASATEGICKYRSESGRDFTSEISIREGILVMADAHLSDLFQHSASLVAGMNPSCDRYTVSTRDGLSLNSSVAVLMAPEGLPGNLMPKSMAHVEDMDALLRGNADLMAVIMLSRRYGGSASISQADFGGKGCSFLTILLPSAT